MQHMLPSLHNCIDFRYQIPEVFCWAFGRRPWDYSIASCHWEKTHWNNADLVDCRVDRVWGLGDWNGEGVLDG